MDFRSFVISYFRYEEKKRTKPLPSHPQLAFKLPRISDTVASTCYYPYIEFFFIIRNGFLALTEEALRLSEKDFYIKLSFPITYGDYAAAMCLRRKNSFFHESDINAESPPPDKLWLSVPEIANNSSDMDILCYILNTEDHLSSYASCSLYFLKHLYLRFCRITEHPYKVQTLMTIQNNEIFGPNSQYTFTYVDKPFKLCYVNVLPAKLTDELFPLDFREAHPRYFLEIPISGAQFLSDDDFGLRYCIGSKYFTLQLQASG